MRRLTYALITSLFAAACVDEPTSKSDGEEADFSLGDPGKADGVLSSADRQRLEAAFDRAIEAGDATIADLEAEIAELEAAHAVKQAEADRLVAQIAQREAELRRNYNSNILLCAFFPNPATCLFANYLANDSTMTSYKQQLANAQAERERIRGEIAEYDTKRDALRAKIEPLRQGKQELLAMLRASAPSAPPAPLASDPATAAAYWRASIMDQISVNLASEVRWLVDLRNAAVELSNTIDQSLRTLRKLEENVEKLIVEQRKQFMTLLAGLASGDPSAAATKFLNQQIAAKTRQLLNQLEWPLNEFARFLTTSRGTGDLQALYRRILEKLIADAQPRIYAAETDVRILDNTRASSALTVSDNRSANTIEIHVDLTHTFLGDLEISVEHAGQVYLLSDRVGGEANSLAKTFVLDGSGVSLSGAWTLHIDDVEAQDTGKLLRWELVAY